MTTETIQSNVNLLGVGRDELRVLETVYEEQETYTKELAEERGAGNASCVRKYLYRLQEEGLIEVSRFQSNRKFVEVTEEGVKRLEQEGKIEEVPLNQ